MARKSLIKKNISQHQLFNKFSAQRLRIKEQLSKTNSDDSVSILRLMKKLQKLPKNSSKSRLQKRCFVTAVGLQLLSGCCPNNWEVD